MQSDAPYQCASCVSPEVVPFPSPVAVRVREVGVKASPVLRVIAYFFDGQH